MTLDSEQQRQTLINCIQSAQLGGMFAEMQKAVAEISEVYEAVATAKIVEPEKANVVSMQA